MLKKEFILRPYQEAFIRNLGVAIKPHRRIIGCAATGAGKSKTFLRIAVNAVKKGHTVLVITESKKIYKQLISEVHAEEIIPNHNPSIVLGRVYLAMAQTLRRRPKLIERFKTISEDLSLHDAKFGINAGLLIINDECHVNEATGILLQLPAAMLIGFSGSPVGKHLVKLYNHLVVGPQPHELVLDEYLTPYSHFERQRAELSQLEVDGSGEFTESSQEMVFGTDAVYDGIIDDLTNKKFKWNKALIFTSSIKHCEETANRLRAAGLDCVTVHSGLKGLEDLNLNRFMYFDVPICVSVGILTKGFDFEAIDFIGLLRKTSSLALYLQMIGRASRVLKQDMPLPMAQRKKQRFYVFDYGQNCKKHLPWDFHREWQTLWRGKPKREGVSPIKTCPQCDYVNNSAAKICVNCGYAWHTLNIPVEQQPIDTVLVEVTARYNALVGKNIKELNAKQLADYALSKGKKGFAQVVCIWHYKNGNQEFIKDFAKAMKYHHKWAAHAINRFNALPDDKKKEVEIKDVILK